MKSPLSTPARRTSKKQHIFELLSSLLIGVGMKPAAISICCRIIASWKEGEESLRLPLAMEKYPPIFTAGHRLSYCLSLSPPDCVRRGDNLKKFTSLPPARTPPAEKEVTRLLTYFLPLHSSPICRPLIQEWRKKRERETI